MLAIKEKISNLDYRVFYLVNQKMQIRILDYIMPRITHIGGAIFTIVSMLSMIIFFKNDLRIWALQGLISLAASHLVVQILKKLYQRERPFIKYPDTRIFPKVLYDYSFPSGHTTSSFSIAVAFALHSIGLGMILLPIAFLVALSRMYLGLHYPSDTAMGAMLGTITSFAVVNWSVLI